MLNTCHVKVMRSKWIMIMMILPYFSPSPANKNLKTRLIQKKTQIQSLNLYPMAQMVNTKRFPITMLSYLMFMIHDFQFGQWTVDIWSKSNEDLFAGKAPTLVKRCAWRDFYQHRLADRVNIMTLHPHHQHQHHLPHHQNTSILVIFVNPEWWSRNLLRKTLPPISLVDQHWAMFKLFKKIGMINNLHSSLLFHQKEKIEKRLQFPHLVSMENAIFFTDILWTNSSFDILIIVFLQGIGFSIVTQSPFWKTKQKRLSTKTNKKWEIDGKGNELLQNLHIITIKI